MSLVDELKISGELEKLEGLVSPSSENEGLFKMRFYDVFPELDAGNSSGVAVSHTAMDLNNALVNAFNKYLLARASQIAYSEDRMQVLPTDIYDAYKELLRK